MTPQVLFLRHLSGGVWLVLAVLPQIGGGTSSMFEVVIVTGGVLSRGAVVTPADPALTPSCDMTPPHPNLSGVGGQGAWPPLRN